MNSQDVTRALTSGSFVFWIAALVLLGLMTGAVLGYVDAAQHASTPGTVVTAVAAWFGTFFVIGLARGTSLSSFIEDKFAGFLEAPLVRPVSRVGLVFGRFLGVVIAVLIGSVVYAVLLPLAYGVTEAGSTTHQFPVAAAVDLGLGLAIAGIVMAALSFLIAYGVSSASAARWATRGIDWLLFVVFTLVVSLANLPVLLVANPLTLPLTLTTGAVPYSVPSGAGSILFSPLQSTRIGDLALLGIGIAWVAATVGGLLAKVRATD